MASILNVDQINNAAGTSAVTIDSSGNVQIPGHVMQVVQGTVIQAQIGTSLTTDQATGIQATITPSSTSNKILVTAYLGGSYVDTAGSSTGFNLYRGGVSSGTKIGNSASSYGIARHFGTASNAVQTHTITYLDSPATTSATTYEISMKRAAGASGGTYVGVTNESSYIILQEIAG